MAVVREPTLNPVNIEDLRPTQITVGMREVEAKPTEDEARKAALESCRSAKCESDKARSACVVVGTFQNQCFAFAGANWVLAATEQAARAQAVANCYGRAGRRG
jgi:Putative ParB-like nuclease